MKKMFAFFTALMLGLTCLPYLSEAKESKHTDSSVTTLPSMSIETRLEMLSFKAPTAAVSSKTAWKPLFILLGKDTMSWYLT